MRYYTPFLSFTDDAQEHFKSLLQEAREKVDEPSAPRLKLGGPKPKVTLNLSQHRNSPTPTGVHIDNDALARQKQMVAAGVNGQQQQQMRPSPLTNGLPRSTSQMSNSNYQQSNGATTGSPVGTAVKSEKTPTPAPVNGVTQANGMMPPPLTRPASGSPFPSQQPAVSSYTYTAPNALPPLAIRYYPIEQALLPTVTINTHPQLQIPKPFRLAIPPHPTLSLQSTTLTLPNSHYFLQICPTISKQLSMGRPYKLFVTLNGVRLNQRDTQFHADSGKRTHVYEGSMMPGVNRIEVEVAASKVTETDGKKEGLDLEKVTVFANLMKS